MHIYLLNKLLDYLRLKDSAIYSTRQSHNYVGVDKIVRVNHRMGSNDNNVNISLYRQRKIQWFTKL